MDFDEYEYLEKTVENPHLENEVGNGGDEKAKSDGKERSRSSRHRSDEKRDKDRDEDEDGRRSKRSRSHHRSRSRDRERDRHRSSRDHRDKEGDRDREKSRDKEERNGKDREREKDKDRESKGRDHEKDRERDRSRRSRSRSERHRSQEREKSQEVEPKERETKDRDRDRRRHKDKKEDKVEPEADPERDQRTVFAYQIALRATERDVYEFFSKAGKVRDVRIIMDRISRRSRGIGYVEFYDTMSVPMAIALSGQPLLGQPVMVKPSEAEKNLVQSTTAAAGAGGTLGPYSGGARRLYVGNLHVNMSEDDLRKVFEAFGTVELVQVPRDETGLCKGFGFVQFDRLEDARNALNRNGQLEIAGRAIKVSAVTDQTEVPEAGQPQNTGDLDDDDGGGLSLNAQSRALLMQKLDRSGTASSTGITAAASLHGGVSMISPLAAPALVQGSFPAVAGLAGAGIIPAALDPVGVPSECLLLKNMFDPSTETEPDFDNGIKEDVQKECSKFGELDHIFVDKNSIYLRFKNTQAAMGAQRALDGRLFAGKIITATYMTTETYEAKFPEEDARNTLNRNGQLEIAGREIKVSAVTDQTEVPEAGQQQNTGDLDDDDGGGLSEEKKLAQEAALYVTRAKLQKAALENFRKRIPESNSPIRTFPETLEFLRPHYANLKNIYEEMINDSGNDLFDILTVLELAEGEKPPYDDIVDWPEVGGKSVYELEMDELKVELWNHNLGDSGNLSEMQLRLALDIRKKENKYFGKLRDKPIPDLMDVDLRSELRLRMLRATGTNDELVLRLGKAVKHGIQITEDEKSLVRSTWDDREEEVKGAGVNYSVAFLDLEFKLSSIIEVGIILVDPNTWNYKAFSTVIRQSEKFMKSYVGRPNFPKDTIEHDYKGSPTFKDVHETLFHCLDGRTVIGHNIEITDMPRIRDRCFDLGLAVPVPDVIIDTYKWIDEKTDNSLYPSLRLQDHEWC